MESKKIRILGRASASVLKKLQLRYPQTIKENSILLFVGYTFTEYKNGDLFDIFIEEANQSWNHDYKMKLDKVYDEFGTSYDFIPGGYKTICLFECAPSVPPAIKKLPALNTWKVTNKAIYFCNHSDIDLLHSSANDSLLLNSLEKVILFNLKQKNRKYFTEQDFTEMFKLPGNSSRFIIDNMLISGALKQANNKLMVA